MPPAAFFGITEGPDVELLQRRLTPHPAATYDSPLNIRQPVGNGLPTTYIACTLNPLTSIMPMRQWARQRAAAHDGWSYEELPTVHNAMMTAPALLTQALLSIAER